MGDLDQTQLVCFECVSCAEMRDVKTLCLYSGPPGRGCEPDDGDARGIDGVLLAGRGQDALLRHHADGRVLHAQPGRPQHQALPGEESQSFLVLLGLE